MLNPAVYGLRYESGVTTPRGSVKGCKVVHDSRREGTYIRGMRVGRNDACPCGSGKKYKRCCMKGG